MTRIARYLAIFLASVALLGAVLVSLAWRALGTAPAGARLERILKSTQWHGERFENPLPEHMGDAWTMLRRWASGNSHGTPNQPPPVQRRLAADFPASPTSLAVTWLGHSSLLLELDGAIILTDPVFSERASPVQFMGPARFHPVPIGFAALPEIDAVVLSHDHYDHLDYDTIVKLNERVSRFIVPLGLGAHLEYWGVPNGHITELDWWEEADAGDIRFVCTPARHFSGRSLTDRNRTLWASWAMLGPQHRVYFSGDTAMFPGFAEVGKRYGPFDLAAIEVGAYDRDWPDVHLGPEQAVDAHRAVRGRHMLPVHWGTFDLALHGWTEPIERTQIAAEAAGVALLAPKAGQRIDLASPPPEPMEWWPSLPFQTADQHPIVSTGLGKGSLAIR